MPGLILAAVTPDNTPHGYNWTYAFPMLLFIAVALVLYMLFSRPHRRVPGRPIAATAAGSAPGQAAATAAAGRSVAAGGGAATAAVGNTGSAEADAVAGSAQDSTAHDDSGASE